MNACDDEREACVRGPGDCYKRLFWLPPELTGMSVTVAQVLHETEALAAQLSGVLLKVGMMPDGDVHVSDVWWRDHCMNDARDAGDLPEPTKPPAGARRSYYNVARFLSFLRGVPLKVRVSHESERAHETSVAADPIEAVNVAARLYAGAIPAAPYERFSGAVDPTPLLYHAQAHFAVPPAPVPGWFDGLSRTVFSEPHLQRAIDQLSRVAQPGERLLDTALGAGRLVASGALHAHAALRVFFYLTQHRDDRHDNRIPYSHDSPPVPELTHLVQQEALRRAALNAAVLPQQRAGYGPTSRHRRVAEAFASASDGSAINAAVQQHYVRMLNAALDPVHDGHRLFVASNVADQQYAALCDAFPDFDVQRANYTHPHGAAASARFAFHSRFCAALREDDYVFCVGASANQVALLPNVVHNCAPNLTGRDFHRHEVRPPPAVKAFADEVRCNSTLQQCAHAFGANVFYAPLSCHDISLAEFVAAMASRGCSDAHVIMHLPVPLLDMRVDRYDDVELGMRFSRDGDVVRAIHLGGASAGYVNAWSTLKSWLTPGAAFDGYHVQVEEEARVGSLYYLRVAVARGAQEEVPMAWTLSAEPFLTLPLLRPETRRTAAAKFFVAPARRFRALVSFCASLKPDALTFTVVASKLRGMLGEVRIGNQLIEQRWDVSSAEFYSLVGHALLAHARYADDYEDCMLRAVKHLREERERQGAFTERLKRYVVDCATLQIARKRDAQALSFMERFYNWLFLRDMDADSDYDPYVERTHWEIAPRRDRYVPAEYPGLVVRKIAGQDVQLMFAPLRRRLRVVPLPRLPLPWARRAGAPADIEAGAVAEIDAFNRLNDRVAAALARPRASRARVPPVAPLLPAVVADDAVAADLAAAAEQRPPPSPPNLALLLDGGAPAGAEAAPIADEEPPGPEVLLPDDDDPEGVAPAVAGEGILELGAAGAALLPALDGVEPVAQLADALADAHDPDDAGVEALAVPMPAHPASPAVSVSSLGSIDPERIAVVAAPPTPTRRDAVYEHLRWPRTIAGAQILGFCRTLQQHVPPALLTDVPLALGGEAWPAPAVVTRGAALFYERFPTEDMLMQAAEFDVPAPDAGITAVLRGLLTLPRAASPLRRPVGRVVIPPATPAVLVDHIREFCRDDRTRGPIAWPQVTLGGFAGCAKSTALIQYCERYDVQNVGVVVPSRALAQAWQQRLGARGRVRTQHRLPPRAVRHRLIIIDECFSYDTHTLFGWLAYAHSVHAPVVLLGDMHQRVMDDPAQPLRDHPVFTHKRLEMCVSNSVAHDAFVAALRWLPPCHYRDLYQTRCPRPISIVLVELPNNIGVALDANIYLRLHQHALAPALPPNVQALSIGQSVGLREQSVALFTALSNAQNLWLAGHQAAMFIALTRHTHMLFHAASAAEQELFYPGVHTEILPMVDGRDVPAFSADVVLRPSVFAPGVADLTMRSCFPAEGVNAVFDATYAITRDVDEEHVADEPLPSDVLIDEVQGVIFKRTNFDLFKDHEHAVDFSCARPRRLISASAPGALVTRSDVRSSLHEAHKMGDVQVSSSAFESLRNVALRTLTPAQSARISGADLVEAAVLIQRFRRCYLAPSTIMEGDSHIEKWLRKRTGAFVSDCDGVWGEDRASVTFKSFLKTQVKVKPAPGYPAQLNYGQQITANSATYSALFAEAQGKFFARMRDIMRGGAIIDCGFSDEELARLLRERAADFSVNTQLDISRQDASHSAAHVLLLAWLLEYAGVEPDTVALYVQMRSYFRLRSLEPGLFTGAVAWGLPSGDPMTLMANCVMMLGVVAGRYDNEHLRRCNLVQKGDDFLCEGKLGALPAHLHVSARVEIKRVDGAVAYHAGRFWLGDHFVADPVRVFCRHFARLRDDNVPVAELYQSYVSRSVDLSGSDERVLQYALPLMYVDVDLEDVDVMLRTCAALKSWAFFEATCLSTMNPKRVYEAPTDCLRSILRRLRVPVSSKQFAAARGATQSEAVALLRSLHIPARAVDDFAGVVTRGYGVLVSPTHAVLVLPPPGVPWHELKESSYSWLLSHSPVSPPATSPSAAKPPLSASTSTLSSPRYLPTRPALSSATYAFAAASSTAPGSSWPSTPRRATPPSRRTLTRPLSRAASINSSATSSTAPSSTRPLTSAAFNATFGRALASTTRSSSASPLTPATPPLTLPNSALSSR